MIYQLEEKSPEIDASCFIADSADVIGDVIMEKNASVWFNCVLRAENAQIKIGQNSNIQDGSVLHVDPGYPLQIGTGVTVGHKVMLHGCTIGDNTLIGINAVVLNGAKIGANCIIGANTLVTENTVIEDGQMVLGSPGKVVRALAPEIIKKLEQGAEFYIQNGQRYQQHLTPATRN